MEKLYSLDNGQSWQIYTEPVAVNSGSVLLAKGINQYNKETLTASYTATISDSLSPNIFDGNNSTSTSETGKYLAVDESMHGKPINIIWGTNNDTYRKPILIYLNENKQEISRNTYSSNNQIFTIPVGTKWITTNVTSSGFSGTPYFYEIIIVE